MKIMTTKHPQWAEFISRLKGPEGCNLRVENGKAVWDCDSGTSKDKARTILERMGGIDVAASLKYFENRGGYCDCEILFNVAAGW